MKLKASRERIAKSELMQNFYKTEVVPHVNEIIELDKKIMTLLKKIKQDRKIPKQDIDSFETDIKNGYPDSLLFSYCEHNKIEDSQMQEKACKLLEERSDKVDTVLGLLSPIEDLLRIKINPASVIFYPQVDCLPTFRARDPVECINVLSLKPPLQTYTLATAKKLNDGCIIKDRCLFLQIDLTYDKEDILKKCDEAISLGQRAIGKTGAGRRRGIDAETILKQDVFNYFFQKHAVGDGVTKEKALEKTMHDFYYLGISTATQDYGDALESKYYPRYKKMMGAKDFKELIKKLQASSHV